LRGARSPTPTPNCSAFKFPASRNDLAASSQSIGVGSARVDGT
jgi:hypothetical protein